MTKITNYFIQTLLSCLLIAPAMADEFDFRDVKLGMTIEEINNLESVKFNYMPTLRYAGGIGGIGCKAAKLSRTKTKNGFEYKLTTPENEKKDILRNLKKPTYSDAPGLYCESNGKEIKTENIVFSNITMKFWEKRLYELQVHYRVVSENDLSFHKSIKTKFLKNIPTKMLSKEITKTNEVYLFDELGTSNQRTGRRGLIIELKSKPKDGGVFNIFKSATPYSGALYIYDLQTQNLIKNFGENVFGKPVEKKKKKSGKTELEKQQDLIKKNLDKTYLN